MTGRAVRMGVWFGLPVLLLCLVLSTGCISGLGGLGTNTGNQDNGTSNNTTGDNTTGNSNTTGDSTTGDGTANDDTNTNTGSTQAGQSTTEQRTFDLVNVRRVNDGATALVPAADLVLVARANSERMAAEDYFSHTDPDGNGPSDRVTNAGITWNTVGENIALNMGYADPALVAAEGWFDSPGHYANIMNTDFVESGMGAAQAADGTWYFTQLFLRRP